MAEPFAATDAAHTVVKAAEHLNWNFSDVKKFIRQVQHVEYGLSSEIEFAAILRWLGCCTFVHRLSEDVLENSARSLWKVPDLFAVFQIGDQKCSTLIEVKTSKDMFLKLKKSYLQRLQAYASLMQKPLLIAWRPRALGFWILFDPDIAAPVDGHSVTVDFELAVKHDLMNFLAGDYWIVPREGAGLRIEGEWIGEKHSTSDGYRAKFRVSDAYLHDAAGVRTEGVPRSVVWAILSTLKDYHEVTDDGFALSFVASGDMTHAQLVLRTAVGFSLKKKKDQRIHWKSVGNNLDGILSCQSLLNDAEARFGTFINYIFFQQPQEIPSFLPAGWANRSAQRRAGTYAAATSSVGQKGEQGTPPEQSQSAGQFPIPAPNP